MGSSSTASSNFLTISSTLVTSNSAHVFPRPSKLSCVTKISRPPKITNTHFPRYHRAKIRAAIDEDNQAATASVSAQEQQLSKEVEESVKVLKNAAKTRKVPKEEVLSALSVIEKTKLDPSGFLNTLGGSKSPGRTWMLIFTAEKQLKGGGYFPLTAVQRFDASILLTPELNGQGKRIENGVFLGPIGYLTFEGRFSWKKRILAFIFECIRIKVGPFNPLEISLGQKDDREPGTNDPFFIWFYIDEEIAVARGRSGGTAFWCRCHRVMT